MKSSFLNLALLAPAVAAGVLANSLSAQAITLNVGDSINTAGELNVPQPGDGTDGLIFNFLPPAAANAGNDFVVTGATGGFSPFALPANANGPAPGAYTMIDTLNLVPGVDFTTTGPALPPNPNNLLFVDPPFNGQALIPNTNPLTFMELEIGDSALDPDVAVQLTSIDFLSRSVLGGGQVQTSASGTFQYVADNTVLGIGSFNATFTDSADEDTSYSATFTVTEVPVADVPEPSSVVALAAMACMGALSLKKKSKG